MKKLINLLVLGLLFATGLNAQKFKCSDACFTLHNKVTDIRPITIDGKTHYQTGNCDSLQINQGEKVTSKKFVIWQSVPEYNINSINVKLIDNFLRTTSMGKIIEVKNFDFKGNLDSALVIAESNDISVFPFIPNHHNIYYIPKDLKASLEGFAYQPNSPLDTDDVYSMCFVFDLELSTVVHELGHNFGLSHAFNLLYNFMSYYGKRYTFTEQQIKDINNFITFIYQIKN